MQTAGNARAEVAAVVGRADHHARRAVLLDQRAQRDGVSVGGVVLILRAVYHQNLVCAVGGGSLDSLVYVVADNDRDQSAALLARHHLAGSQQLNADILGRAVLIGLYKYPKVFRLCFHCNVCPFP